MTDKKQDFLNGLNLFDDAQLEVILRTELYRRECPPALQLGEYQLEMLSPGEVMTLERHVADCPHCQAELESLTAMAAADAGAEQPGWIIQAIEAMESPKSWLMDVSGSFRHGLSEGGQIVVQLLGETFSGPTSAMLPQRSQTTNEATLRAVIAQHHLPERKARYEVQVMVKRQTTTPDTCEVQVYATWRRGRKTIKTNLSIALTAPGWVGQIQTTDEKGVVRFENIPTNLINSLQVVVNVAEGGN